MWCVVGPFFVVGVVGVEVVTVVGCFSQLMGNQNHAEAVEHNNGAQQRAEELFNFHDYRYLHHEPSPE